MIARHANRIAEDGGESSSVGGIDEEVSRLGGRVHDGTEPLVFRLRMQLWSWKTPQEPHDFEGILAEKGDSGH